MHLRRHALLFSIKERLTLVGCCCAITARWREAYPEMIIPNDSVAFGDGITVTAATMAEVEKPGWLLELEVVQVV